MFNQGLGQPRMTVEDRICDMMMQLDEHSEKIPEGMYLQFCDHLKVFHQNIKMNRKLRQKLVAQEAEVLAREVAAERLAAETEVGCGIDGCRARETDGRSQRKFRSATLFLFRAGDVALTGRARAKTRQHPFNPPQLGCVPII